MKAVVTGANGYIGSYVAKELLESGFEVIAISRNFSELMTNTLKGATLISCDVLSDQFTQLEIEADYFFHLASANDIISKDFNQGVQLSLIGTKNSIEFCLKNKIKNYIFFSTLQVLGTELKGDYKNDSATKIESNYAFNHFLAEEYLRMVCNKGMLNGIIVRPSNIFGAMLDKSINRWSLVPNCFCKEGVEKGSITLMSSGNQNRNFLSLKDIAKLSIRVAQKFKNEPIKVFNFGYFKNFTILEFAKFTQNVFEEEFQMKVSLQILSDQPTSTNTFSIDTCEYADLMYDIEVNEKVIKEEIKKIIKLIK